MSKPRDILHISQVEDGEPYYVSRYETCCDCGLTHTVKYEALVDGKPIKGAKIRATVWRNEKRSKEVRRRHKHKCQEV